MGDLTKDEIEALSEAPGNAGAALDALSYLANWIESEVEIPPGHRAKEDEFPYHLAEYLLPALKAAADAPNPKEAIDALACGLNLKHKGRPPSAVSRWFEIGQWIDDYAWEEAPDASGIQEAKDAAEIEFEVSRASINNCWKAYNDYVDATLDYASDELQQIVDN